MVKQGLSGRLADETVVLRHGARHPVCKPLPGKTLYVPYVDTCISPMAEIAGNSVLPVDRTVPFHDRPRKFAPQKGVAGHACPAPLRGRRSRSAQNERHCPAQRNYTALFIHDLCLAWYPDGSNENNLFAFGTQ